MERFQFVPICEPHINHTGSTNAGIFVAWHGSQISGKYHRSLGGRLAEDISEVVDGKIYGWNQQK